MENQEKKHKRRVRYSGAYPKNYREKYKELQPEKYADTISKVIQKGSTPAGMHLSICVKEILDFLDGNMSLEEAVSVIKRDTRHFAKRQLTWFRRERDVFWLDWEKFDWNEDRMLRWILSDLTERGIIKKEQIQSWN